MTIHAVSCDACTLDGSVANPQQSACEQVKDPHIPMNFMNASYGACLNAILRVSLVLAEHSAGPVPVWVPRVLVQPVQHLRLLLRRLRAPVSCQRRQNCVLEMLAWPRPHRRRCQHIGLGLHRGECSRLPTLLDEASLCVLLLPQCTGIDYSPAGECTSCDLPCGANPHKVLP